MTRPGVFILYAVLSLGKISSAAEAPCLRLFDSAAADRIPMEVLMKIDDYFSHLPTVSLQSLGTDGLLVFHKKRLDPWGSSALGVRDSYTPQGDPRSPMLVFGPALASLLGFRLSVNGEIVEYRVPSAKHFSRSIHKINTRLKAKNLEPISYLPVSSGFSSPAESMALALKAQGDFDLLFPYADHLVTLASHEVSYHLAGILLPKKTLQQAHQINVVTQDFINFLKTHLVADKDLADKISEQLLIERAHEIDAGTATAGSTLAVMRRESRLTRYAELFGAPEVLYASERARISEAFDLLSRPNMPPLQALFNRLERMLQVHMPESGLGKFFFEENSVRGGFGKTLPLSPFQKAAIKKLIDSYISHRRDHLRESLFKGNEPESVARTWIRGLDQRIADLVNALEE